MKTSTKGLELIKQFEGCSLKAYKCPAGVWTIGYGHTRGVRKNSTITQATANKYLADDILPIEIELGAIGFLSQAQFDALVSFIFNVGMGNFSTSTLRKKLVAKATNEEICDEIVRWHYSKGKPLTGLKRRRVAEANLFFGEDKYYINSAGNVRKR